MVMTKDQLNGKGARLRVELAAAHAEPDSNLGRGGRIDRIARELDDVDRALGLHVPNAVAESAASQPD
jgi:hypothetical protein